jgi:hypothetical protein
LADALRAHRRRRALLIGQHEAGCGHHRNADALDHQPISETDH